MGDTIKINAVVSDKCGTAVNKKTCQPGSSLGLEIEYKTTYKITLTATGKSGNKTTKDLSIHIN